MNYYDVFNGDADGICALHQLRLSQPRTSTLITGLKRDIALLGRVTAQAGDHINVLDISLDKNKEALNKLLQRGVTIDYFDHHMANSIPEHPGLKATIDTSKETCTSLLVDAHLNGAHRTWAVVAAFGDNLHDSARRTAAPLALDDTQLSDLCDLGTCLNYNGYGFKLSDLFFHPADLYCAITPYHEPFAFIHEASTYQTLLGGYRDDMATAASQQAEFSDTQGALYILPDAPWARRVNGVFGNSLARDFPARAHAILTVLPNRHFRVSVRAPLATKEGADILCSAFPTGGGRKAAAGINDLPPDMYDSFIDAFRKTFA